MATTITGSGVDNIVDGTITNADINASAGIAGSKLTDIKTVNGSSLIGSGDLTVGGGKVVKATVAYNTSTRTVYGNNTGLTISSENFTTPSNGYHNFNFTKSSSTSTIIIQYSLSIGGFHQCHVAAMWRTDSAGSSNSNVTNFTRFAYDGSRSNGSGASTSQLIGGSQVHTGLATGSHAWWWSFGRSNDGAATGYRLNPDTNDDGDKSGSSNSNIIVYEIEI